MKTNKKGLDTDKSKPTLNKIEPAINDPKTSKIEQPSLQKDNNDNSIKANNERKIIPSSEEDYQTNKELNKSKDDNTKLDDIGNSNAIDENVDNIELAENSNLISPIQEFLLNKLKENCIEDEIMKGVSLGLEDIHDLIVQGIIDKTVKFDETKKNVTDIIQIKENKRLTIEDHLRQQKIKENMENKEYLENKIKSLQENINLLENNDVHQTRIELNLSTGGKEIIDENIRKSRLKEIKQAKEVFEKKLFSLDDQIKNLIEEETNGNKKVDVKTYLENFEKDKKEAELRIKKWEKEREERNKIKEEHKKMNEIKNKTMIERNEKENHEKEFKKHQEYIKKLERMKDKSNKVHEEVEALKEEWKSKIVVDKQYKYKVAEEEFKHKQDQLEEEKKNKALADMMKKKNLLKPINREELNDFSKKYMEQRQKILYEKEKERLMKQEELIMNTNLPKPETQFYQNVLEEEKKNKELKEKEKLDKVYVHMKIKQFSKDINLPKVDDRKRKEREDLITRLESKSVRKHKRKSRRILLVKPKNRNNTSHNDLSKISNRSSESVKQSRSKSTKRKPMVKLPDYLTEMRVNKVKDTERSEKKWDKMIKNNKYSLLENVEQIKIRAQMLEEQAKMKEKYLMYSGGTEKNPEMGEHVSNMMIDAIKAKLTILENISTKK